MLKNSLVLIFLITLEAQNLNYSGYVKAMPSYSNANSLFSLENNFELNTAFNARLNLEYQLSENITFVFENKIYGLTGQSNNGDNYLFFQNTSYDYFNLNSNLYLDESTYIENRIDRINLNLWFDNLEITVGRQRISWGKNFVWSPTDIFHPTSPTDFDNEEKNGADALYAKYFISDLSSIEYAVKFINENNSQTHAIKYGLNLFEYDFSILAALRTEHRLSNFYLFGLSWSGEILGAGFRGEIVHFQQKSYTLSTYTYSIDGEFTVEHRDIYDRGIIAAISMDYTFENSFYLHTEVMTNTVSFEKYLLYYRSSYQNVITDNPDFSIFQEFSYQLSPLTRIGYFLIYVPETESLINYFSMNYSMSEVLDLSFFALLGEQKSIIDLSQQAFFVRLKYYF